MRRTTITQNRFTTSTQSWLGKTSGFLLFFSLIFAASCKDDATIIGFAKDPRLNARFVDIPLDPSVIQFDGILTRNLSDNLTPRILVGTYSDPAVGLIEARGYSNFVPPATIPEPSGFARIDKLELTLEFDLYYYGSRLETNQHIKVFELRDTLLANRGYYSNTIVRSTEELGLPPLGEADFTISPTFFDEGILLNTDADTTNNVHYSVTIPLDTATLGRNLLDDLINNQALFIDVPTLSGKYKGFSFVMTQGDKIIGIKPNFDSPVRSQNTRLTLYYTDTGVPAQVDFLLYSQGNTSFSKISTDRGATSLNGIQAFQDFVPPNNRFYVQSGTALVTKLDLTNFYNYVDTLDNIVFNSAEVVVTNNGAQVPPTKVLLRVLDTTNHFRSALVDSLVNGAIKGVADAYFARIPSAIQLSQVASSTSINARADQGSQIAVDPETHVIGKIFITEFCQQIYKYRSNKKKRIRSIALMSDQLEFANSVNMLDLDPSISLRLYYSKPVVKVR